jgi:signal transduction histidine kinase
MLLHITQWEHSAIAFENIALKPVLEEVENELSALYAHKNIVCTLDLKDVSVLAQKDVVRSIFFNLIQNAYKYTPEKGTIALFCDAKKFVVTNSGSEIPEAHHAKIRTRFWKDHRGEHQEGFGLGLYLVKLLVTKLNRTVQVSSEQHQTSFTVYFQS